MRTKQNLTRLVCCFEVRYFFYQRESAKYQTSHPKYCFLNSRQINEAEYEKMGDDFHDKHAKYPSPQDMDPAKEHAEEIAGIIFHFLQERGMVEWYEESNSRMFIEQGSSYEGTKTETTDLEFDLLFLLPSSLSIIPDDSKTPACYAYLKYDPSVSGRDSFLRECTNSSPNGWVSISEVMDKIKEEIKNIRLPRNVGEKSLWFNI